MSFKFIEFLEPRRLFTAGLPRFDHVVIIVEENHDYADIIGSASQPSILWSVVPPSQSLEAPYIRKLAKQGASLQHMHGETHPSQPNYLAMFSGSTQGVTSDTAPQKMPARMKPRKSVFSTW